jgi:tetratricopeptide (TPR) repeat protein
MEKPFLIVNASAMPAKRVGDYVYRIEQPSIALGRLPSTRVVNIRATSPFFETVCLQADVLVVHLLTGPDLLPLLEERIRNNYCTVFEIPDNFMDFHPTVGVHALFGNPRNTAAAFQYIRMADAVQTPGKGLRDRFLFVNNCIKVMENQIMAPGTKREQSPDGMVIGWGGSLGHIDDLWDIMPCVTDLCARHSNVSFRFMGDPVWFGEMTAAIPAGQKQCVPTGMIDDYLRFIETLDVGIAPMLDTGYNACRSDIKFVEYSSRGVVPLLASLGPYRTSAKHGENAFLYKNKDEFIEYASLLTKDPELRKKIGANAYMYACIERTETRHVPARVDFYRSLCRTRPAGSLDGIPRSRMAPDSDAWTVDKTPAEEKLIAGINAEALGDTPAALALYREAATLDPCFYLPHFWLGYSAMRRHDGGAAYHLERALKINSRSLRALICLGEVYSGKNDRKAHEYYSQALRVSANFTPAIEGGAKILEQAGEIAEAEGLYNAALRANPFSSDALLGLGRVYEAQSKNDLAARAYETAADLAPNSAEAHYALARFYFDAGRNPEALHHCIKSRDLDPCRRETNDLMKKLSSSDASIRKEF